MSTIEKEYLNFDGLSTYDGLLKEYIETGLSDKIDKSSSGYQTITGNPLEFDSPSPQIVGIKCDIEASQDMHGYDKPWVGGESANMMPAGEAKTVTESGITFTSDGHGRYSVSGTATADVICTFNSEVEYRIPDGQVNTLGFMNNDAPGRYVSFLFYNDDTLIDSWEMSPVNKKSHYSGMYYVRCTKYGISVKAGTTVNMTLSPMICAGDFDDFPSELIPYSNICPIAGVDTIDIDVTGKNRLNPYKVKSGFTYNPTAGTQLTLNDTSDMQEVAFGQFQKEITAWQGVGYLFPLTSEEMYFKIHYKGSGARCTYGYLDADLKVVSSQYDNVSDLTKEGTIQGSETNVYFFFMVTSNANATIEVDEPQIEAGTTATTYEPYVGETYIIDLDGTRYGGQLDVTSGVLTVDKQLIDLKSLTYAGTSGGGLAWSNISNLPTFTQNDVISDKLGDALDDDVAWFSTVPCYAFGENNTQIRVYGSTEIYTTGAYADTHICIPMQPTTVQLTPTQVWAVQGGNVITVSVDGVEAEIHSSNYATLKDISNIPYAQTSEVTKGVEINPTTTPTTPGSVWITT